MDCKASLTSAVPCPIATMDPFGREFLAACHAEAHQRAVQAGLESVPCKYCGRCYGWHVRKGVSSYRQPLALNPTKRIPKAL